MEIIKMKRRFFLIVVASLLIFSLILSSFGAPSQAAESVTVLRYTPTLGVKLIAEDDQLRDTGIIVLGLLPIPPPVGQTGVDLIATYKLMITLNGIPVKPDYLVIAVLNKTKVNILITTPPTPPARQFPSESLRTNLTDVSYDFVGKYRSTSYASGSMAGLYVLDIYYIGPITPSAINDYMVLVQAGMNVGSKTIWGEALTDLCILGWSMSSSNFAILLPDGSTLHVWDNPLGSFTSSDDAVLWQKHVLGVGFPSVP